MIRTITDSERALHVRVAKLEAELAALKQQKPYCYLYFEGGEEMFATPGGYRPSDAKGLYLAVGAQTVQDGYQLVPIEPTQAMCDAVKELNEYDLRRGAGFTLNSNIYRAMLQAAKEKP